MNASAAARTAGGRFPPGVSGNPSGRPKGSRNFSSIVAEALREGEAEALVRIAVAAAFAGDKPLLRFFMARIWPAMRGRLVELALPAGQESDPQAVIAAALRAVADGVMTSEEAALLGRLVRLGDGLGRQRPPVSDLLSQAPQDAVPAAPPARMAPVAAREAVEAALGGLVRPGSPRRAPTPYEPPAWLKPPARSGDLLSSCSGLALAA
jgi:hypothetical protein